MPSSAAWPRGASWFLRDAQRAGAAGDRPGDVARHIFNGAIITEQVFGYPGVGSLLVAAVYAGDFGLVLGVTTISIIARVAAVLVIDLAYPLLDPARDR